MTSCEAVKIRIHSLLKERDMTLYRLEQNSGIFHGTMHCIMTCKNKTVTLDTIVQIASAFDMTAAQFMDDDVFKYENLDV